MNSTEFGAGAFALSLMNDRDRDRNAHIAQYNALVEEWNKSNENMLFLAKGQVHGLRAGIAARKLVEKELIAALKAENANHPLASEEAVEALADEYRNAAIIDPEVIKRTYPDGMLPEGVLRPPDMVVKLVD
jgi:hypothetical protein